jgi:hypothetical protein
LRHREKQLVRRWPEGICTRKTVGVAVVVAVAAARKMLVCWKKKKTTKRKNLTVEL